MEAAQNLPSANVEYVFADYRNRRSALIKALTTDVEDFSRQCDPANGNLFLYGLPSGQWVVKLPGKFEPSQHPEPAVGINFSRDLPEGEDWLGHVAKHSDSWLLSVAYCFGARFGFDKVDRQRLFDMINELPTVSEVVAQFQQSTNRSSVTNISSTKFSSSSNVVKYQKIEASDG